MKLNTLLSFSLFFSLFVFVAAACDSDEDRDASVQVDNFVQVEEEPQKPSVELDEAPPTEAAQTVEGGAAAEAGGEVVDAVKSAGASHSSDADSSALSVGEAKVDTIPSVEMKNAEVKGFGSLGLSGTGRGAGGSAAKRSRSAQGLGRIGGLGMAHTGRGRGKSATMGKSGAQWLPDRHARVGTEAFKDYGTNSFVDPRKDSKATFAADVDTASYSIVGRKLRAGVLPPLAAVRVEEFVNAFDYDYGAPDNGPFSVRLEAAPSPFSADPLTKILRVGVQAKALTEADRKPAHVTFLVDVSGSMSGSDRLELAKYAIRTMVANLRPTDTVSIVTYAGRTGVALELTDATDTANIEEAIDGLRAGGSTGMGAGMKLAYEHAVKRARPGHVSRVVVMSDGDANLGARSHNEILEAIGRYVEDGVTMSTVGFGVGNYKDVMMEQLANRGNGNYLYIEDEKAASRAFEAELDGLLHVVAKDVKFQVEFSPEHVNAYRLIGYENRDIADEDFRDDSVDAGEVGAGHRVTALFEVRLKNSAPSPFATVRIRHKDPDESVAIERAYPLAERQICQQVSDGSKDFQFAVAVSTFAEILRKSSFASGLGYDLVLEIAESANDGSAERAEFVDLVKRAARLEEG